MAARLTAAERAPLYGVDEHEPAASVPAAASATSWPSREELTTLRQRAASGATLLAAGRHAPGDRELRRAMTGLARRGDWTAAHDAALALAASLLRRGRPRDAKAVLDASGTSCHRASHDDPSIALAMLVGVAWTDLGRLDEAERVLSAAAAAGTAADDAPVGVALALARCRFWRGRFPEAHRALEGVPDVGLDPRTTVRLQGLRARIAVGRLDFSRAMSSAADAVRAAETAGSATLVADARCTAGFVHLAVDDIASLSGDADACIAAAAAARDPLRAFRVRLLLTEQFRRAGRRTEAQAVLRVLNRFTPARLPPILRRHYEMVAETMASAEPASDIAARHATASGLGALVLFAPRPGDAPGLRAVVEDAVAMLRECQGATEEDEEAALGRVCETALRRLEAAAVAFYGIEGRLSVRLAGHGSKIDASVVDRASVAAIPIMPHRIDDRVECAVPIRCGGLVVGVLAARWTIARSPDSSHAVSILTMAATAAAPLVQSLLAARARAAVPASHGLLGVSAAMNDIRRAADRAAAAPFAVLIEGESGSGKELVARAVHRGGARRDRPFGRSIARRSPTISSSPSSSATHAARSPARLPNAPACSRRPIRRHAAPRRSRRAVAAGAGEIAARDSGRRAAPDRRKPHAAGRRADRRRDQSRSAAGGRSGPFPRSTSCIGSTSFGSPCRRCANAARTSRCSPTISGARRRTASAAARHCSPATVARSRATIGRATFASCRTSWPRSPCGPSRGAWCRHRRCRRNS